MVTNRNEALEGLRNGDFGIEDISGDLKKDPEVAIELIKEYGEKAIDELFENDNLPHTPEVFFAILENSLKLKEDNKKLEAKLEGIKDEAYIDGSLDEEMALYFKNKGDLRILEMAIKLLESSRKEKLPEKGGQEH